MAEGTPTPTSEDRCRHEASSKKSCCAPLAAASPTESRDFILSQPLIENGRYVIPWPGFKKPGITGLMKFMTLTKDYSAIPSEKELDRVFPVVKLDKSLVNEVPGSGLRVTWLGHATVLLQMDGANVLTDPVFSDRCGPMQTVGAPRRYRPPPCGVDELPTLDAVIISHNHYDHLDYGSVIQLRDRFGDNLRWFVPLGLKTWMVDTAGCIESRVTELGWWNDEELLLKNGKSLRFICVPAQHWSKRALTDDNKTLWGGWCIIGPRHRFYFAGDTGYNDYVFKTIGRQFGPFDLAAIPIGAYNPRWFMQFQHVDPEEAFKMHEDVNAWNSIGIHWGTFKLSAEYYLEPRIAIEELQKTADERRPRSTDQRGFFTTNPGHSVELTGRPPTTEHLTLVPTTNPGHSIELTGRPPST